MSQNAYSVNTTKRPSQNVPLPPQQQVQRPVAAQSTASQQHYTREQLKEDLKNRDAKSRPYSARPGETAWAFEKEQMMNQGAPGVARKRGIRGLFASDHAAGAEKEARKEMWHAEKAERFATRARDPALTDRQRQKFLRKAAKQQASADFHESLKKKHIIGATPGHKYQAVPPMATHHPIIHDNATNTVRTTVNDQVYAPSRIPVGPAAFDGISEVGARQELEPHPAVLNVSTNIKPQQKWKGQVSAGRKISENQPAYIPTGDRSALPTSATYVDPFQAREQQLRQQKQYLQQQPIQQQHIQQQPTQQQYIQQPQYLQQGQYSQPQNQWLYSYPADEDYDSDDYDSENEREIQQRGQNLAPITRGQLREGAQRLQYQKTQVKQARLFNDNQLRTQATKLRKGPTIEKGGLNSFGDEWARRKQWRQQNQFQGQQYPQQQFAQQQFVQQPIQQQFAQQQPMQQQSIQQYQPQFAQPIQQQRPFVLYANQPALQRQSSNLKKVQTKQRQQPLQARDLTGQGQRLRKVQTVEKGGLQAYADEFAKKKQQKALRQQQYGQLPQQQPIQQQQVIQQQPMQQMSKLDQQRALQANNNNQVAANVSQIESQ